ncbi:efflux RND transporter permease subunit [Halorussus lipolyticus]|uniref:efflux RND transporter permease subunit n=1 Tax=Halorussus lipolyticus TaxID=3034024 RepID=UPI0023E79CCE|nr:MMPL family transporter [Halorussus sp. DT80]
MSVAERVSSFITEHSRIVIVVMILALAVVGAGASNVEQSTSIESLASGSDAAETNSYVRENFSTSTREGNTTTALITVRNEEGNVLSKASLLRTLRYQQAVRSNETINDTLVDDRPTFGIANLVARAAIYSERRQQAKQARQGNATNGSAAMAASGAGGETPTLDEQIDQLESMDDAEVEQLVERMLAEDSQLPGNELAYRLLPTEYEAGSATADARLVVVTQQTEQPIRTGAAVSETVAEGEMAARDLAKQQPGPESYLAFGFGMVTYQENIAITDSFGIIGPLAILFVLVTLSIAYRDLLDIVLGLLGVFLVVHGTFGVMGWAGITFNQVMIAVPILLIGLSVDYALHVVMRYREERAENDTDVRTAMKDSLTSLGPALALVTATTSIGFLANLTSSVGALRTFGVVTAVGIVVTLVVFGVFIPALKSEIDSFLEGRGWDRSATPFGSGGRLRHLLRGGATLARRAPLAVLVLAVLVSACGAYGATQVESSFSSEAFIADDPAEWTDNLPEQMQPSDFFLKDSRQFIYENFQSPDKQGKILVRGNVTSPETLDSIAEGESAVSESSVTFVRPDGEPAIETPLSAMQTVADENETFNATFQSADTDGDGVPDRNLEAVYDDFYATAPDRAERTVYRTDDGTYEALKLRVAVVGTAGRAAIADELQNVAGAIETDDGTVTAAATGRPVVAKAAKERLTSTLVESLALTLVAILVLLAVVFRAKGGSATLGALTLTPVVFTVSWLLGTMAVLEIPISLTTALVGSISLGLGVDYAIHVSERFSHELESGVEPMTALERTVVGTGGALLSSAVTTAAGFGVLTFSLLPGLQRFGFILAVGIVYAFLASVFIQPSLLALWTRYGSPRAAQEATPTTADD